MHLIGKETAPELGHALAGALYGPIGIALAVGYAFEGIREHIAKTNEELDKMGEKAAAAYANVKANLFDAIRAEEFSTDKVDKFFKHIEDDAGKAQKAIESALKIAHELESATIKKLKADEENELARIKIDPKYTTDAQREAASAATKTRYAGLIAQQEEKGQNDDVVAAKAELTAKQKELNDLLMMQNKNAGALNPDQMAAVRKAGFDGSPEEMQKIITAWSSANAKEAAARAEKDLGHGEKEGDEATAKKLHDKFDDKISGWNSEIERVQKDLEVGKNANGTDLAPAQRTWMQEYVDDLKKKIYGTGVEQADAKVKADEKYIEQQKTAEKILAQQAQAQKDLTDAIEKLKQSVQAAQQKFDETKTIADIRNNATGYVADKNASTTGFGLVDKLMPKHDGGGEVDAILRAYAAATGETGAQTTAIIQGLLNHTSNLQTVLKQMQDQLDQQQRQLSNSRNRPGG
jgi:hypothetical protein